MMDLHAPAMTAYYVEQSTCLQMNAQSSENLLSLRQHAHSEMIKLLGKSYQATHIVHDDPQEIVLMSRQLTFCCNNLPSPHIMLYPSR